MAPIDPVYLLAIGVALIAIEIFAPSFFFFWMGTGFVAVGVTSYIYAFEDGITQLAVSFVLGLILALLLRKKTAALALKSDDVDEEHAHVGGKGIVENGRIKFDGTFWKSESDLSGYNDGDSVDVIIKDNRAIILTGAS